VTIRLPPLRERAQDIDALVELFVNRYSKLARKRVTGISHEALERLKSYSWPGNIRQLENTIEQAVVLSTGSILSVDDLPREVREGLAVFEESAPVGELPISDLPNLDEVKKRYTLYVIAQTGGNISRAAKILNIDRRSLYRMLTRWKVDASSPFEGTKNRGT
jgi:two-component system response regulator AtoC